MQPFGTILLLLLSSAALVLLGHVFRLLRWEQFIRIYEYPQRRSLLRAMAGGYAVQTFCCHSMWAIFCAPLWLAAK